MKNQKKNLIRIMFIIISFLLFLLVMQKNTIATSILEENKEEFFSTRSNYEDLIIPSTYIATGEIVNGTVVGATWFNNIDITLKTKSTITNGRIYYYLYTGKDVVRNTNINTVTVTVNGISQTITPDVIEDEYGLINFGGNFSEWTMSISGIKGNGIATVTIPAGFFKRTDSFLSITGTKETIDSSVTIDTTNPIINSLIASPTNWTSGKVTLKGKAIDTLSGINYYQFSTDDLLTASSVGWKSIASTTTEITQTYEVSTNGTYYFYVRDGADNINKATITVSNIDKTRPTEAPTVTVKKENGEGEIIEIIDPGTTARIHTGAKSTHLEFSGGTDADSGVEIYGYATSTDGTKTDGTNITFNTIKEGTTYYVWTKDKAGNYSTSYTKVTVILDETAPTAPIVNVKEIKNETEELLQTVGKEETATININTEKKYRLEFSGGTDTGSGFSNYSYTTREEGIKTDILENYVEFTATEQITTYYVFSKDCAGNYSKPTIVKIILDTDPPEAPIINIYNSNSSGIKIGSSIKTINGGETETIYTNENSPNYFLQFSGGEETDRYEYATSSEGSKTEGAFVDFYATTEGTTYYVWTKDNVGNYSTNYTKIAVKVDNTAPEAPTVTVKENNEGAREIGNISSGDSGTIYAKIAETTLEFSGEEDNEGGVGFATYAYATSEGETPTDCTSPLTFNATTEGTTYYIYSKDNAGNYSEKPTEVKVILDNTAPKVPTATVTNEEGIVLTAEGETGTIYTNTETTYLNFSGGEDSESGFATYAYATSEGETPTDCTSPLTFDATTEGTTYYIYSKDNAGNYSATYTTATVKLDNIEPVINVVPSSAETCRNCDIVITASNIGGSELKESNKYEYYLSENETELIGGEWKEYTNETSFKIGEGIMGTRFLFVKRISDNVGNVNTTKGESIAIEETIYQRFGPYVFDNTPPTAPTITAKINDSLGETYENGTWTNQNVYIELHATDNSGQEISNYQYSIDGETWLDFGSSTLTYSDEMNSNIKYRAVDEVGKTSSSSECAIKIDKSLPVLPTITVTSDEGITLTAEGENGTIYTKTETTYLNFSGGEDSESGFATYAYATKLEATPTDCEDPLSPISFNATTEGTTYYIWTKDNAGNYSGSPKEISVILDNTAPTITLTQSPAETEWTNGDVIITVSATDNVLLHENPYSWDEGLTWEKESQTTVTENKTCMVYVRDATGNYSSQTIDVVNIDKIAPPAAPIIKVTNEEGEELTAEGENGTIYTKTETTYLNFSGGEDSESGFATYAYATNLEATPTDCEDPLSPISFNATTEGTTYYVWTKDNAGNYSTTYAKVTVKIDNTAPTITIGSPSKLLVNQTDEVTYRVIGSDPIKLSSDSESIKVTVNGEEIESDISIEAINADENGYTKDWDIKITNITGNGEMQITIPAGFFEDGSNNKTNEPTESAGIIVDNTPPECTIEVLQRIYRSVKAREQQHYIDLHGVNQ